MAEHELYAAMEQNFETFVRAYNRGDGQAVAAIIGEGTVDDPSLEPEQDRLYSSVDEWVAAARRADDQIEIVGLGPHGGRFRYFIERSNPELAAAGIDRLAITWTFSLIEGCGHLVESLAIVSIPDPCRYDQLFDQPTSEPNSCASGLTPRAGHAAVWTGTEVLIVGGTTGVAGLTSGIGYDPVADTWRDLAPIPPEFQLGYSRKALWTGAEMIVVGSSDTARGLTLLGYDPAADTWSASPPLPGDRTATGGLVWTGTEVLLGGGDNLYPDNSTWAYRPSTGQWRQLPDSGLPPSEGMEAVWIGDRALFFGGYGLLQGRPGAIYDPATDTWQPLPAMAEHWIESHDLVWTGEYVIVYSGHTGPAHPTSLLLYHPESNAWSTSEPLPVASAERLAGAWTGERFILWGGLATYGAGTDEDGDFVFGHGASYDPATDTWSVLAESPLGDRCDHSGTWTGEEFIVFGGLPICGDPNIRAHDDAASYDPATDTWQMIDGRS